MTREEIQAFVTLLLPSRFELFGPQRYALLFQPGTYGTDNPLNSRWGTTPMSPVSGITERRRQQWIDLRSQPSAPP
jgi:hypothetical protein